MYLIILHTWNTTQGSYTPDINKGTHLYHIPCIIIHFFTFYHILTYTFPEHLCTYYCGYLGFFSPNLCKSAVWTMHIITWTVQKYYVKMYFKIKNKPFSVNKNNTDLQPEIYILPPANLLVNHWLSTVTWRSCIFHT